MGAIKGILVIVGVAAVMVGSLFMFQGLGIVRWPSTSFMIDDRAWVGYGSLVVLAGGVLLFLANRPPKS
ncbi:Putative membrane protein [Sphingopyxis fribergensis]|uniref:Putative membrane protein n=1 Tax=Sphingopyxis fribergensis TaxID=1515612 RepID=A0A0A7PJD6_9SPHN|nr:hypothetical protein [Sphingopyxis fribergensis]AJA10191.1 Putative membrane protein [Sphingopyxis fribergensis]